MSAAERFFDTNLLLYLFSSSVEKADRAEELLSGGGTISVQVLNEFAAVARRKLQMAYPEIREALDALTGFLTVVPLTIDIHQRGMGIAERYGFSVYDAQIVAAAIDAGCRTLFTEDMQHLQQIDDQLVIINPFV